MKQHTQNQYVVGFLFDDEMKVVVLIDKKRPEWQAGKLNGVGGKVNDGEAPLAAMKREFAEEAGVSIDSWRPFCELRSGYNVVNFFYAKDSTQLFHAHTETDEEVIVGAIASILSVPEKFVPNLPWLLCMARSFSFGETAASFLVLEAHDRLPV